MQNTPVASYSLTVRLRIANQPGMLGIGASASNSSMYRRV